MALRALLWDVDGTLAETEIHGHREAYNVAFRAAGLPWQWDVSTYRELLAVSGGRERLRHFFRLVGQGSAVDDQVEWLMVTKQRAYADLARQGALTLRPGVERLVTAAAARGWGQALVTTSSRSAVEALLAGQPPAVASAFAFWICGEDVIAKKPSPEGYRRALERLDLSPREGLALEDSPQGLASALAADLPCVLTLAEGADHQGGGAAWWHRATAVVDHLGEDDRPMRLIQGPPCCSSVVTPSWLAGLLEAG
jgi:HAD superfamily hydrolase (TIGR01509 family)